MAIILIVEDRPIDRELLATILRTRGHEIVEASDGKEALDALKQIRPDLVVSDILMPRLDGYEFARRVREIPGLAATPVIFYTATYHESKARALAYGGGSWRRSMWTRDSSLQAPGPPLDRPEHPHLVGSAFGGENGPAGSRERRPLRL